MKQYTCSVQELLLRGTLKASLHENKNKKMVLEQKRIRIEGQLSGHEKEIKELENNMKHLRPLVC